MEFGFWHLDFLLYPLPESQRTHTEKRCTKEKKDKGMRPEDIQSVSFQEDTSHNHQKIPDGYQVGYILNHLGHIFNREHETGEDDRREGDEEIRKHSLLLGTGDGGNKNPQTEGAHDEDPCKPEEEEDASLERQFEPEYGYRCN